jgi:hypothetical protein
MLCSNCGVNHVDWLGPEDMSWLKRFEVVCGKCGFIGLSECALALYQEGQAIVEQGQDFGKWYASLPEDRRNLLDDIVTNYIVEAVSAIKSAAGCDLKTALGYSVQCGLIPAEIYDYYLRGA